MESFLSLVEGSLGALVMVGCGLLAIISVPISICAIVVGTLMKSERSWKFYAGWLSMPAVFLIGAIAMFILRSLIVTFFDVAVPE